MLKNTKKIIMVGALVSTIVTAGLLANTYASTTQTSDMDKTITMDDKFFETEKFDIIGYIKGLNFLTEDEKQKLIEDEKKAQPIYDEIDKIYDEIDKISDRFLDKSENLFEKINKIYDENEKLWEKFYDDIDNMNNNTLNEKDLIKSSTKLTKEEKDVLLKEQDRLDAVYNEIDKKYDQIDKETAPLYKKINELYKKIDKINEKNESIWEKVNENDKTPILY